MYRILKGPITPKLSTITDPFKGSTSQLSELISSQFNPFDRFIGKKAIFRAPTTFVLSHKSSASNGISYMGLLTDYFNLKTGWKHSECSTISRNE